jgi:hypothetical protein
MEYMSWERQIDAKGKSKFTTYSSRNKKKTKGKPRLYEITILGLLRNEKSLLNKIGHLYVCITDESEKIQTKLLQICFINMRQNIINRAIDGEEKIVGGIVQISE